MKKQDKKIQQLLQGFEGRRVVFEEIKTTDTIISIGEAKILSIRAKVNRMKKAGLEPDIMYLITCSRKELRSGRVNL